MSRIKKVPLTGHSYITDKMQLNDHSSYVFDTNRREVLIIASQSSFSNENGEHINIPALIFSNQPNATNIVQNADFTQLQHDEHATILGFADAQSVDFVIEVLTGIRDKLSQFEDETHE